MLSEVIKNIEKYNKKHRELIEKQNYFFKKYGKLKFGMDKKEVEKKWKSF